MQIGHGYSITKCSQKRYMDKCAILLLTGIPMQLTFLFFFKKNNTGRVGEEATQPVSAGCHPSRAECGDECCRAGFAAEEPLQEDRKCNPPSYFRGRAPPTAAAAASSSPPDGPSSPHSAGGPGPTSAAGGPPTAPQGRPPQRLPAAPASSTTTPSSASPAPPPPRRSSAPTASSLERSHLSLLLIFLINLYLLCCRKVL